MGSFRRSQNKFLAELPEGAFDALAPHLRTVHLLRDQVIAQPETFIRHVYFPHGAVISNLVVLNNGDAVEVGLVARDGVFGDHAALLTGVSPSLAVVRYPGTANVIDRVSFRQTYETSAELRTAILEQEWCRVTVLERWAACNAAHTIEARLCGRLLTMRDLAGSEELPLTQETLAQMLGVRRNSISLVAIALQRAELLRYSRGKILLLDLDGLRHSACDCHLGDHAERQTCATPLPPL